MNDIIIHPHNLDAETSILGGILYDNQSLFLVMDFLNPEDFFTEAHQVLYFLMREMINDSRAADIVSVHEELKRTGKSELAASALIHLNPVEHISSARNIEHWGRIVKNKSRLRQQLKIGYEIVQSAQDPTADPNEIHAIAEAGLQASADKSASALLSAEKAASKHMDYIQRLQSSEHHITGIETGIHDLDRVTDGLQKGEFTIVAARPSKGKTAFLTSLLTRVPEVKTLFFSIEQKTEQILNRMVCAMANIDGFNLRTGRLDGHSWSQIHRKLIALMNHQFWIDDSGTMTLNKIRATAKRIKTTHGLDMVIVDYLGLVRHYLPKNQQVKRYEIVTEVSHGLKALAKDLNVQVCAAAQLNRDLGEFDEPELKNLRESGDIEQDADLVLFLWTMFLSPRNKGEVGEMRDMITVAKQRNGETGQVRVVFRKPQTSYENYQPEYQEQA